MSVLEFSSPVKSPACLYMHPDALLSVHNIREVFFCWWRFILFKSSGGRALIELIAEHVMAGVSGATLNHPSFPPSGEDAMNKFLVVFMFRCYMEVEDIS